MPNRSFWVEAKETLEQTSKTTPMSSRILGIGVVCVSFLVLSIGLIVGLKFPGFVEERIKEDLCVVSERYDHFHEWEFDEQLVRKEKIYFRNITNLQQVLDGEASPMFKKVGPYVYEKKATKADIMFNGGFLTYKYVITFDFDVSTTRSECGIACTEIDKISTVDLETLEKIRNFKSYEDYIIKDIPDWIKSKIEGLSAIQTNSSDNLFSLLGSVNKSNWNTDCLEADFQQVRNISFGGWIALNDTDIKSTLLEYRNNSDFTRYEMGRLYDVISSPSILGLSSSVDTLNKCQQFLVTAPYDCQTKSKYSNSSFCSSYKDDFGLMYSNYYNICGIFQFLQSINKSNKDCFMFSSDWVRKMFCYDTDTECKTLMSIYQYRTDYIFGLKGFIFDFLVPLLRNNTERSKLIFRSFQVQQLVIGYQQEADYKKGIFTLQMEKENSHFSVIVTLSTCLLRRNSANNMVLYKYQNTPISYNVHHYTYFLPPLKDFKCCSTYRASLDIFKHFSFELGCSMIFALQGLVEFSGVDLYRFIHGEIKCQMGISLFCCDSIDGYVKKSYGGSYIDVEPISGRFWRKVLHEEERLNLQSLDGILREIFPYVDWSVPILIYIRSSSIELSVSSINQYNTRVKSMMKASCIGMISLTAIATIIFLIAICIVFWPKAKTKVHPFILEQSHNLQQNYRATL